jgi:hypothetical protein
MLNLCSIVVTILKMVTCRNFPMSGINSGHHNLPTYGSVEIGQCWICVVLWWPFWKWRPVEIFRCRESIRDTIIYPHIKCWWYRTMLNFCGIGVAILKMATGRNFSISGINSGHHYLPTIKFWWYQKMLNFYRPFFIPCFGSHFENGRHLENFENAELLL